MNCLNPVQVVAAFLACLGMLIPAPMLQAEPHVASTQPQQAQVPSAKDVVLRQGGTLVGQVFDSQGRPLARTPVALRQLNREVACTAADENGVFAVSGLRGGTYQVAAGRAAGVYRLWAANTAPPSAQPGALLVEGGAQVRGQGAVCALLSNPWVLASIVTAAVAVPIIVNNTQGSKPRTP